MKQHVAPGGLRVERRLRTRRSCSHPRAARPFGTMTGPPGTWATFCHVNCVFCIMEDVNDSTQGAAAGSNGTRTGAAGGVQSIERAFNLLEMLADAGGALGLSELSTVSGLPLPTVHRLMRP